MTHQFAVSQTKDHLISTAGPTANLPVWMTIYLSHLIVFGPVAGTDVLALARAPLSEASQMRALSLESILGDGRGRIVAGISLICPRS